MPVTVFPSNNHAEAINPSSDYKPSYDPTNLLTTSCLRSTKELFELLQSSFSIDSFKSDIPGVGIFPQKNGLVHTILEAYNQHHNLILRPEDIWLSILIQFNFFINANAEYFRSRFVSHQGKKQLEIIAVGDRYTVDYGQMSSEMGKLIEKNILDKGIRDWFLPDFSTTKEEDRITASMVMMSTFQSYFEFLFSLMCGLPSVTLDGVKEDWIKLESKIEKLKDFNHEDMDIWYGILKPILKRFVKSFEEPESEEVKDFWQKVVHYSGGGSGPTYLSGWITAFTYFSAEGERLYNPSIATKTSFRTIFGEETPILKLDEAFYDRLDTNKIPTGSCQVPIKIDDNGTHLEAKIAVGMVGMRGEVSREGMRKEKDITEPRADTVSPVSGWWIFEFGEFDENDVQKLPME